MQSKYILAMAAIILITGAILIRNENRITTVAAGENVRIVNNQQIIALEAKGGFSPTTSVAKAGIPSILQISTNGTYDCSSAISIPSLGYRKNLPATGVENIEIPAQEAGTTINGTCSMGMYSFSISFE